MASNRIVKAIRLSMDPALILLALGQAYLVTAASKESKETQLLFMSLGGLLNLVVYNYSTLNYDANM